MLRRALSGFTFAHQADDDEPITFDISQESSGTQYYFIAPARGSMSLLTAKCLLFDEIDRSLHPKLTSFLIKHFHSKEINKKNAQLIFTTHNTTLLDLETLRRDQIWFVSKQKN